MSRSVSAPSSVTKTSPCWNGFIVPGATCAQQVAETGGGQTLAERGRHPARDEDVPRDVYLLSGSPVRRDHHGLLRYHPGVDSESLSQRVGGAGKFSGSLPRRGAQLVG